MDDGTSRVQHDIAVVPVFDLQEETEHTVGGHTPDEIPS